MARKKVIDWPRVRADLMALKDEGYAVKGKVITHWRIHQKDTDLTVEVWPTKRKFMLTSGSKVEVYTDILATMREIFKSAPRNRDEDIRIWREGLDKLHAEIDAMMV